MKKECWNLGWEFCSDLDPAKKKVDLPHDAMQTEKRVVGLKNGSSSGFYPGGTYTYTKTLTVAPEDAGKTVLLECEGIYQKSSIFVNDKRVGGHIYGYTDFYTDLTKELRTGENEIRIVADNSQAPNSRWYSGSGIYRDVSLLTAGNEYICPDGIRVKTISIDPVKIEVCIRAQKTEDTKICFSIRKNGETAAEGEGSRAVLEIPDAELWSYENPALYEMKAELIRDGMVIDSDTETFGIRMIAWNAQSGLMINGKSVKLRGGCVHHDHTFIGAAEYDCACERKMRIMKDAGFNAVRISHHPASRAMLRACDRIGMYVMNETFDTWHGLKSPYDYAMYFDEEWQGDIKRMEEVSFNHPSVIMYCIGNEVYIKDTAKAVETTKKLTAYLKSLDDSRPITNAINPLTLIMGNDKNPSAKRNDTVDPRKAGKGSGLAGSMLANTLVSLMPKLMRLVGNEKAFRKKNALLAPLDIVGFNYADYLYEAQHRDYPDRVLVGTETFPSHVAENWELIRKMPCVVGDFLWTAWDYLGEASIGRVGYDKKEPITSDFPYIAGGCASIDLTGQINCQGYFTKIVYGEYAGPYIAVHPLEHAGQKMEPGQWRLTDAEHSWSWKGMEGKTADVDVYASGDSVELFQDGVSLGKKKTAGFKASYRVPFRSGELKAVSYDKNGKEFGTDRLVSADDTLMIKVVPEKQEVRAGRFDLLYIPIELTDENGTIHMLKDRRIRVRAEGEAKLLAVGSAALLQESLTPYTVGEIDTFRGRALAILRTTETPGQIKVTVSADGPEDASAVVFSR